MDDTMLVRLKKYDPRRGHVLRRFTVRGFKFHEERGWYRVKDDVADYLRGVHQLAEDPHSPPAFDVCTLEQAKALDAAQAEQGKVRRNATDDIRLSEGREPPAAVTTRDLPEAGDGAEARPADGKGKRGRTN